MPYLNGDRTTDASGNGLLDGLSNAIQTPPFDFSGIITWVRGLYDSMVGVGKGDFWQGVARFYLSVYSGNPEWLTAGFNDPDLNNEAGRVKFLYDWLEPGASDPGSLRTFIANAAGAVRQDAASPHLPTIEDVLNALAAGPPVTLPSTPPPGYGGSTAEQVWGHYLNGILGGGVTADEGVSTGWLLHRTFANYAGIPVRGSPFFSVDFLAASGGAYPVDHTEMAFDITGILPDDTVLSWLTRTDTSGRTWEVDPVTGMVRSGTNLGQEYHTYIYCLLTDADLQAIRAGYGNSAVEVGNVPPVWPGLANVTLGTPVALDAQLELTGPLDGVLVNITSPPPKLGSFDVGGVTYYYRVGSISFVTDNGEAEPSQYLGFENAIYTPRCMKQAASAILRVLGAAGGTATPFTVTV